jgi:hypothetical protein
MASGVPRHLGTNSPIGELDDEDPRIDQMVVFSHSSALLNKLVQAHRQNDDVSSLRQNVERLFCEAIAS